MDHYRDGAGNIHTAYAAACSLSHEQLAPQIAGHPEKCTFCYIRSPYISGCAYDKSRIIPVRFNRSTSRFYRSMVELERYFSRVIFHPRFVRLYVFVNFVMICYVNITPY
jgi:hypothetical protein